MKSKNLFLSLLVIIGLMACQPAEEPANSFEVGVGGPAVEPEPDVVLLEPTQAVLADVDDLTLPPPIIVTAEPPPAVVAEPLSLVADDLSTPLYKVVDVASDDVLNVRSGAGVDYPIVGALAPHASAVRRTGTGQTVGNSLWVPIELADQAGWVNSTFLTEMNMAERFCTLAGVQARLQALQTAISQEDGQTLAQLVHPEGLSVGLSWWNPQVRLPREALGDIFQDQTLYDWGQEGGSGLTLQGTFVAEVLPHLQKDFLTADVLACNDILHGPTAGLVQLPEAYERLNFYAFHRSAPADGVAFDWGTWVVGLDEHDGQYYIRYLLHFRYEA